MLLVATTSNAEVNTSVSTPQGSHNEHVSENNSIPGGGWQVCENEDISPEKCNTVGMAWADDNNQFTGYIMSNKQRGQGTNEIGDAVESVTWNNIPKKTLYVTRKDKIAGIKMIESMDDDNVSSTIITSKGKTYTVSGWAKEGEIQEGQRVCKSGWGKYTKNTEDGVVCGNAILPKNGSFDDCREDNIFGSSCQMGFYENGSIGGNMICADGDDGAPVWTENSDDTVTLVGIINMFYTESNMCTFEPTYSITQAFSGKPYIESSPLITIKNDRVVAAWNYPLPKEEFLRRTDATSSDGEVYIDMPDDKYFELYKHPDTYEVPLKAGNSTAKVTLEVKKRIYSSSFKKQEQKR